ncbi:MAG: YlbF family regulator [Ignavibacteriales bacterium]|nr:YlbF family regulator [Ignavibacteriales bacterium]
MLNTQLQTDAELFVNALINSHEMKAFVKAKAEFQGNPELREVRKQFGEKQTMAQSKQSHGTITQEEIDDVRALQKKLNSHPVTSTYTQTRQVMVNRLHECNDVLSKILRFDFASAAAPPSCCG